MILISLKWGDFDQFNIIYHKLIKFINSIQMAIRTCIQDGGSIRVTIDICILSSMTISLRLFPGYFQIIYEKNNFNL